MVELLECPILGLEDAFPESVHVLHHPSTGKYGCYCHEGVHGVASFESRGAAMRFSEQIDLSGIAIVEVSFEDAREIAKARPMPVVALMLLDRLDEPLIHYVR